jgi:histidinol-phosphate aminotransferase
MGATLDTSKLVRPVLAGFEPYDPAFSPCEVNLSANENTHALPDRMRTAIEEALLRTPLNRYPDPMANDVRDELAAWHQVGRTNICVGNGGDEILFNVLFAFGGAGRTLTVTPPCFEEYKNFAAMCECEIREVWRDPNTFAIDADALLEAAKTSDIVMVTSPNNPTGDLIDPDLVRRLLTETEALVLLDEAYIEFSGDGASLVSWVADYPRLMILRTFSKAFALAGMRCGYLIADTAIIDVLAAIRQIYSVDVIVQAVAVAALKNRALMQPVIDDIVRERAKLAKALAKLPGARVWESGANFVLLRIDDAATIRARLRDEHSVLVRDFSYAKGLSNCLRITVGTAEENETLLSSLKQILGA